jgi:hemin uptake protein HemP
MRCGQTLWKDYEMTVEPRLRPDSARDITWSGVPVHRSISSRELMAGEHVIIIRHEKEEYRLRLTASGKLILTK